MSFLGKHSGYREQLLAAGVMPPQCASVLQVEGYVVLDEETVRDGLSSQFADRN